MTASGLPDVWLSTSFGDLCLGKGEYGANSSKADFDPALPRYVRITDISEDGDLKTSDPVSISNEDAAPYLLAPGDILLARSGATVGKSYVHREDYGRCAYAGYLIRFRANTAALLPHYMQQF